MKAFCRVGGRFLGPLLLAIGACTPEGVPTAGLGPITTGSLSIGIDGLPAGAPAAVIVTNSQGFQQGVTVSTTLRGLTPGTYTVAAAEVASNNERYGPTPASQAVAVIASTIPATTAVAYVIVTGRLQLTVTGVPAGIDPTIEITGPSNFLHTSAASETLTGLAAGSYHIAAPSFTSQGDRYDAVPAGQDVVVTPGSPAPAQAAVVYGVASGRLIVTIAGLPGGAGAAVQVTGPAGFSQSVTRTDTLVGLTVGAYTLAANSVSFGGVAYVAAPATASVLVTAGTAPSAAAVSYSPAVGALQLTVTGLPGGASGALTVTGPGGFSQSVAGSMTLPGLAVGSYTVSAATVSSGGFSYAPTPVSQGVAVTSGGSAGATVAYAASTGSLTLTINGLPGGIGASVTVTGPGGYFQLLTGSQTLTGLTPGSYAVAAGSVVSGPTNYTPAPVSQSATVTAGSSAAAAVTYTGSGSGATLNLTVNGAYLTQATQKYDGSVPLVAGRNAYLRVFALANQANGAAAQVRVRLYSGVSLVQTYTLSAPASSVPTAVDEGILTNSWNVLVPGALVQPNLRVLADVDPSSAIAESNESDNQFPLSGTPGPVDVRSLPTFSLRFVPVLQQVNGLQGNVSGGTQESYLNDLKKILPVGAYDADIRAPYTTTAAALQSDNANGAWGTVLSELLTLRFTEGSTRYYYGVVKTAYSSGVAGIGYVGGSARTAMGWDLLPSGSSVMAHELGHNMTRQHAPCGGVAGPDPEYPYVGGKIGVWGLDLLSLSLKSPATYVDLMGYCSPVWVSDYNWSAMVAYRQSGPSNAPAADPGPGQGLLIWGRITSAGVVLEPAFTVAAAPFLAPLPGPDRLDLQAANGSVLRSVSFDAADVADLPGGNERHFAFVVPLEPGLRASLGQLTVRSGTRSASRISSVPTGRDTDPASVVTRNGAQQVVVRWNAQQYPMVMVRDGATGEVISFARGGSTRLWTRGSTFDLQFSDGVKAVVRRHALQ